MSNHFQCRVAIFAAFLLVLAGISQAQPTATAAEVAQRGPTPLGYTGKSGNDSLQAFDPATGMAAGSDLDLLPGGNYPYDATLKPDGSELWIAGAAGDGVIVIDTSTGMISQTIDLGLGTAFPGEYPVDILFGCQAETAYAASRDDSVLITIDTATYTATGSIAVSDQAGKMALDVATGKIHSVAWFDGDLFTYDPSTGMVTTTTAAGNGLWDAIVDPDARRLYLIDRDTDQLRVLDADTLAEITTMAVGEDPWGVDITPDGSKVLVANEDDPSVSIVDAITFAVDTVDLPVSADPRDVDIDSTGTLAYVPTGDVTGNDGIYVIDIASATLIDTIDMGTGNTNVVALTPQLAGCGLIFDDGFESGNADSWSSSVGI